MKFNLVTVTVKKNKLGLPHTGLKKNMQCRFLKFNFTFDWNIHPLTFVGIPIAFEFISISFLGLYIFPLLRYLTFLTPFY